ncbi:MAG: hypothetical protein U5L00_03170 [Desulfovermiculus sp.]|nr:hypothetical protein [Desulfovermiculus sp.]
MGWTFWTAIIIVIGVLAAVHFWEKRSNCARELTEQEMLFVLARSTETSEFDHFRLAAKDWNISYPRIEADFNRYLLQSTLPPYVRDYLRKVKASDLVDVKGNFFTGILINKSNHCA